MSHPEKNDVRVVPKLVIPGGAIRIEFASKAMFAYDNVECVIGGVSAKVISASRLGVHVLVPEGVEGQAVVEVRMHSSDSPITAMLTVGRELARDLHNVANPAIDPIDGSIVATRSGGRGQTMPVSLFRIRQPGVLEEVDADILNPTGLAFDQRGNLFVSARSDGEVWKLDRDGRLSAFSTGLGVATGIAFDSRGELHVGDRTGSVFRLSGIGDSELLAKLEPSVAAFHLAFDSEDNLYVTAPSLSGFDSIQSIDRIGFVRTVFRGLGRPQGIAFDSKGVLFVVGSFRGCRGIVRISPESGDAVMVLAGPDIVGLAFRGDNEMIVGTRERLYSVEVD